MPITLEVGYFNSFYVKKITDLPKTEEVNPFPSATPQFVAPSTVNLAEDWYIEESRIRGGYNNTSVDLGVKAYIVEDNDAQQRRSNSLIYSGVFNSRTGVNQSNQFSTAEEITRSVDPAGGSIQKLYAEDTNLIIFQEDKVNRALIDKDAIYSAEGSAITTSANLVIGQIIPYAGEYGISTNPESFAVYGYQKYFTDKNRNAVLRLSRDGITEISNYGMVDFFRDKLSLVGTNGKIIGAYDVYSKNYVVSLQPPGVFTEYYTLNFDEATNGWVSFFDYKPSFGFSSQGNFFTTKVRAVYKHYTTRTLRGSFYGPVYPSVVKFVFNPDPTRVKTFNTINYEGSNGWEVTSLVSDETGFDLYDELWEDNIDTTSRIYSYDEGSYFENNIQYRAGFDRKQNKYLAAIKNNSTKPLAGQVLIGPNNTGLKAYYATVTMKTDNTTNRGGLKELFAVGATYGR
tara:strand:+ start:4190 stop:5560 length:1371 start_codon:yes stop_codon:yes gene_type:complete